MTIVFNSHYMDEVEMYADRLVMLNRGRVVAQGTVDELRRSVGGGVVELVVDDVGRAVRVINGVGGLGIRDVNIDGGRSIVRIIVDNAEEALPMIITALKDAGVKVTKASMSKPTLDDVFLKYTGGKIVEGGGLREARMVRTMIKRG